MLGDEKTDDFLKTEKLVVISVVIAKTSTYLI